MKCKLFLKSIQVFQKVCLTFLLLLISVAMYSQDTKRVTGIVKDSFDEPLIGVSVTLKGTGTGTVTDIDGKYSILATPNSTLVFSYVGMNTQEVKYKDQTEISIKLEDNAKGLEEVIVIGYGTAKRKDVTTAISSVSTEDLEKRPIVSAGQAMQGKAAGVSVIQPSGTPGGEMTIRVRGTSSFNASNSPLYVVDGVPVDNINFLAPNDIQDMQILKDASSAAIYGSRAANGVVLITTKKGKTGDAKVSFNTQFGFNRVSEKIKPLNTKDYLDLQKEIGVLKDLPDNLQDRTNWFDEAYSTGITQSYQASVSDGTEKLKYFLSAGYLDEKGVLKTAFFKRYNFRANIDNQVKSWLKISASISYTDNTKNGVSTGAGSGRGGVVLSVINTPKYAPIWDPENPGQYYNNFYGMNIGSPLENMARSANNKEKEHRLIASGSALITLIPKQLTLKSSFTLDRRNGVTTRFLDPQSTAWGRSQYGEGSDERNTNTVLTFDNVATYNKSFGKHGLEAMLGTSWTDSQYTNNWVRGTHYNGTAIQTLNAANKITWNNTGSGASQWGIMSYFGRASYNYDSKYLFTANVRADGSSKIHPDQRWGVFPSFSGAWRISSEDFMKDFTWLDDLKLRGGWGMTGNQSGLHDFAYLQRFSINRVEWFKAGQEHALPIIKEDNLRTKDLKWETTIQTGVGLDITTLNSRLSVILDYYHKRTKDMLMNVGLPTGQISDRIARNEGEMINKGFEITINSRNLQGAFSWNTDFNISFNRNKLTKLELQPVYYDAETTEASKQKVVRNESGRSLSGFYGYISDGVNPETGELMYRDLNGDGVAGNPADRTYIGDPNPDFTFGLTNSFAWKNFDLSIFIYGSYGNDIYNASRMDTEGMQNGLNQSRKVLDRWRVPGQITSVPKAMYDMKNSSYFVEDGSFLKVKNITLSYNVKARLLDKLGISRLQPYFTASNLLTWTSYSGADPEVNQWGTGNDKDKGGVQGIDWGTYPHSKSFMFGVNIEF